jgi:hypothetical protein
MAGPLPRNERFSREYGCTEREWVSWMPLATGQRPSQSPSATSLSVTVGAGHLHLAWQVLEPRRIALISLPRLEVTFTFEAVPLDQRLDFMRQFDRHLQRGGG